MAELLIGRDEELNTVRAFLAGSRDGPAVVLLEGEAGIGKTTIWEAVLATDVPRREVLRARPAEAEMALSFAGLSDLLAGVLDGALPGLPAPQRRALEVALLLEPGGERPPEHRAVAAGFLGAMRVLARSHPVLVAIDDVQWLDGPSATVLAFALRRLDGASVDFLLTERVEAGAPRALGLDRPAPELTIERVRIERLSLAALQRLVHVRLGAVFPRPMLRRIHDTSGGNPFFALELARALEGLEPPAPGEPLPVPDKLHVLVERRLAGLPGEATEALLAAALLGQPTLARLEAAVGPQVTQALRPAIEAHVARIERERVRFEHPLLVSGLVDSSDSRTRRALHRRLAETVEEPEERARHLALAAEGPDESVAATLVAAAQAVAGRGAPEAAAELAERARRLTPPDLVRQRGERAAVAGWHAWQAGDAKRARELLQEGAATYPSGPGRAKVLDMLVRLEVQTGDSRIVPDLCRAGLSEAGDDPRLRAALQEILAWAFLLMREDMRAAARHARFAVELAEGLGDSAQLSDALSVLAQSEFLLGGGLPSASMERALALRWDDLSERAMRNPRLHWSLLLQCADQLDEARINLENVYRDALARGDESALPWIKMRLSQLELQAGNWQSALAHADSGYADAVQTGQDAQAVTLVCARALVEAHLGRADEARPAADRGLAEAERFADGVGARLGRWALGHLALSLGDAEEAERVLGALWRQSRAAGIVEPGENRYLGDYAEALVALERLETANEVAGELAQRGEELDRPAVLAVAARCRGLVACARGELDRALGELEDALTLHEQVALPFQHARTLLALGHAQRRARQRRNARRTLEACRASFAQLGATLWELRARRELARIGGRAPARSGLTQSELRVATLVAEGRTNREVAAELVVTERTVETHLSHIYRKLGVRSRTELARRPLS
jgi:DNA-binding CsgD family transcriptional regulator/tetratricopeptide (TPR) repeat protein